MIQSYSIKHENNEDILYLYLDYNYEFASFEKSGKTFFKQLKDFLKNKSINFKGQKIVLIVSGVTIGTILLSNIDFKSYDINNNQNSNDISYVSEVILNDFTNDNKNIQIDLENNTVKVIEEEREDEENIQNEETINNEQTNTSSNQYTNVSNNNTSLSINKNIEEQNNNISSTTDNTISNENKTMVTVYRSNGNVEEMELEEYLIGVVAGEMPASFNNEALKVQAIIARTYALKSISQNKKLTDSVSTQVYIDEYQMQSKWGSSYSKYYNKIKSAVESTSGMYITYNGQYIDAVYFSTSNGYTEDSYYVWGNNIPYLKSVESKWDIGTTNYTKTVSKSYEQISNILGMEIDENTKIENIERNASNRVSSITINEKTYTGVQIRTLFGLNSTDFDIEVTSNGFTFTNRGYGHGVGLSQYGANGMANEGYTYEEIIKYYYQGVNITK